LVGRRVVATARRGWGVRDAAVSAQPHGLAQAVRAVLADVGRAGGGHEPDQIVAAGMLTSEVGLAAVPHVAAPAGLDDLARGAVAQLVPAVAPRPILFVPGVRTPAGPGPDGWAAADLMRGEECETFGALEALFPSAGSRPASPVLFVWPGSHTKLVAVDDLGRIVGSYTTLAGELMAALAQHTILAASLPKAWPERPDPEAVAAGARLAQREGLGRAAFLVRIAAVTRTLDPDQRAAFWLGAVVADDVGRLVQYVERISARTQIPVRIWVGGRQPQRGLYTRALAQRVQGTVTMLEDAVAEQASALGALAVAERWAALN
jgi:2-dehydro-3-deoxygalactonokinase